MGISPIITQAINYTGQVHHPPDPAWATLIARELGIQVITIDGNILPMTALLLMFAVWGVWYWVLMIQGSIITIKKKVSGWMKNSSRLTIRERR